MQNQGRIEKVRNQGQMTEARTEALDETDARASQLPEFGRSGMLVNLGADQSRTGEGTTQLIEINEASFDPWRVQPVRHRLPDPPLLQTAAVVRLGELQEGEGTTLTRGATRRQPLPHAADWTTRDAGITPPPVWQKPLLDAMRHAGIAAMLGCGRMATAFTGNREQSRRARPTLVES